MTNKEAASILKNVLDNLNIAARGNGKPTLTLMYIEAYLKAIDILERTPD